MGLILDSSILIASERLGEMLQDLILRTQSMFGTHAAVALSSVSIVELTHGIFRAQTIHSASAAGSLCRKCVLT
jgi:predicted nucleic acid-binding protein